MRAKTFNTKLRAVLFGLFLMLGAFFAYSAISYAVGDTKNGDCTSNAVIRCGVKSMSELRQKYANDYTKGTKNIYSYFGLNSNVINNYKVERGVVYKKGDVKVNGKLVATGAHSAGREYLPGSKKHTVNGTTFYTRPLSVSTPPSWDVYVFSDSNGRFVAAVMLSCGNPVMAKPVKPAPKPVYKCTSLSRLKQAEGSYKFVGKSHAANGAKYKGFTFDFGDGTAAKYVKVQRVEGSYGYAEVAHKYQKPGTYNVKVTAHFTVNGKEVKATSDNCQKPVTVKEKEAPKVPGVSITKQVRADVNTDNGMTKEEALEQARNFRPKGPCTTVMTPAVHLETGARYEFTSGCLPEGWVAERNYNGPSETESRTSSGWVEHVSLEVGQNFEYKLVVKNTGEVTLEDALVTDSAPTGVQFLSADKGTLSGDDWSYAIPELKPGDSLTVVIQAKVTKYVEGRIVNTACVDAQEVPGDSDDCDDATVEVEKPESIKVCDLDDKSITWVTKDQLEDNPDRYTTDLTKCEEKPETPEELPQTGLGLALNGLAGIGTLTAAGYYYITSRRL